MLWCQSNFKHGRITTKKKKRIMRVIAVCWELKIIVTDQGCIAK